MSRHRSEASRECYHILCCDYVWALGHQEWLSEHVMTTKQARDAIQCSITRATTTFSLLLLVHFQRHTIRDKSWPSSSPAERIPSTLCYRVTRTLQRNARHVAGVTTIDIATTDNHAELWQLQRENLQAVGMVHLLLRGKCYLRFSQSFAVLI